MIKEIEIGFSPEQASNPDNFKKSIATFLRINEKEISHFNLVKKSIDARKQNIILRLKFEVFVNESVLPGNQDHFYKHKNVKNAHEVAIIGSGPAGLFAALELIENG
ncbi:MAG: FAD-binding protein, partial [Bacteroidetes bacterium]|nr:FAD-binding protein [Bacteroidota bacterium]